MPFQEVQGIESIDNALPVTDFNDRTHFSQRKQVKMQNGRLVIWKPDHPIFGRIIGYRVRIFTWQKYGHILADYYHGH